MRNFLRSGQNQLKTGLVFKSAVKYRSTRMIPELFSMPVQARRFHAQTNPKLDAED